MRAGKRRAGQNEEREGVKGRRRRDKEVKYKVKYVRSCFN